MPLRPLEGFVVGVTADRRASEQAELFARRGAGVLHGPTIRTEYLDADDALRTSTATVIRQRPDYLVATTGIGIRAWFEAAQAWGLADGLFDALAATRIAARGPKAAAAIQSVGLTVEFTAASEQLDETLASVVRESLGGTVVAFQHFGEHRPDAITLLTAAGAEVVEVPVYRWRAPADETAAGRLLDATISGQVDALTFTSAPALDNFVAIAERQGVFDQVRAACNRGSVVMACIGPVCAAPALEAGIHAPVIPARGRLGLLVRAVTDALQERRHTMRLGPSDVVVQGRAVSVDGQTVEMAPRERAVFELLLERRGAVVGKPTLLRTVWGDGCDTHAVEATVARLRQRLGPAGAAVQPVRGRGYRLHVQPGGAGP